MSFKEVNSSPPRKALMCKICRTWFGNDEHYKDHLRKDHKTPQLELFAEEDKNG